MSSKSSGRDSPVRRGRCLEECRDLRIECTRKKYQNDLPSCSTFFRGTFETNLAAASRSS
jgi:hypothetical protein